ncbi:aminopeptidase N [Pseudidiomarina sediminum]|uniref:Aminopeptidase N n=1 Tax=Pseudidiomarina sediminum TaxID=431675 RepID=A0A432Z7S4_9GAMM|nr:aminopeptidase N [Pseudidiomarina sediminum]RUO73927.1 aminopeptidase N [Pseudidiomarina sediminum]
MSKQVQYRSAYRAPVFTIDTVDLHLKLDEQATEVTATLTVRRLAEGPLVLDGEQLELVSVQVNGVVLSPADYQLSERQLQLNNCPDVAEVVIVNRINPSANSALEGLYKSGGAFCTQCEAEGFRRITYYLDRPDVLAVFTTTIEADARYTSLLSNGNLEAEGALDNGRHFAKWHDPHPKPAYLFALVAGDFDRLEDHFTTMEGREVLLELFVDKGNLSRAHYAMGALKRAMKWDEERFGLAYDLDRYMIVAVDFFNMGAMENKGLNIFNSKYVLADQQSATDWDFIHVESVIGHEYFHNWTGNRITCRDWFQLSLKEGLTVFRDQEFSADLGSRAVHRIDAIRVMRSHQFSEDASPMAHPIRPDKVVEMNNFYTVTVYNKGAEVIRMLHTLLGEQGFQAGMQLYRQRHDGQAVTCEDFVVAMEDANQRDLTQFRRWYSQAGTPEVRIEEQYDAERQVLKLKLTQQVPPTPEQPDKEAMVLPLLLSAYSETGQPMTLAHAAIQPHADSGSALLELTTSELTLEIEGVRERPVVAWLENFSAPVKLYRTTDVHDYAVLLGHAAQEVTRWEAAQQIYLSALQTAVKTEQEVTLPEVAIKALRQALAAPLDNALKALIFTPPSAEELAEYYPDAIPLAAIERAVKSLASCLAEALRDDFSTEFTKLAPAEEDLSGTAMAARALQQRCLYYLTLAAPTQYTAVLRERVLTAQNMTVQQHALETAVHLEVPEAKELLEAFAQQWQATPLALDKWFAIQATSVTDHTVAEVERLAQHAWFDLGYPNRVYALVASFCRNSLRFHQADGAGYRFVLTIIKQLNTVNPQVAARLVTPFLQWRRYDAKRQQLLRDCLVELRGIEKLAPDLEEKISHALDL